MRLGLVPLLLAFWLLLNQSLAPGHWLLGLLFAVVVAALAKRLRPLGARPKRPLLAVQLLWHVFCDIVRSNIAVSSIILGAPHRQPRIGFLDIPLDLRDPHGLATLAMIVTATPGTVWAGHDQANNILTLHILDLQDEHVWIHTIKERYERPLREIFE